MDFVHHFTASRVHAIQPTKPRNGQVGISQRVALSSNLAIGCPFVIIGGIHLLN
ncbi:unnamed protein product [Penicillium salamii]|nr:unnamed protein product [Penicillium salamii]